MHIFGLWCGSEGYKCLDSNGKSFVSNNIVLNELVISFETSNVKTTQKIYNPSISIPSILLCISTEGQGQVEKIQMLNTQCQTINQVKTSQHNLRISLILQEVQVINNLLRQ